MRYLSLCSGIEATSVAWRALGWTPVAFAEIEPFACAVLAHRYPDVVNLGDINRYQGWCVGAVDLLVAGTPCPSFSVAGRRVGLDDPRGQLALVWLGAVRRFAPRWIVWENVPGVLSTHGGRDFGTLIGALADLGFGLAWRVLDAQYFGLAQRRRRVFVVGCAGNAAAAAAVLLEPESLRGDPAPRREARQDLAPTVSARTRGGGGLGTDAECDGALIPGVARALTSSNERIDAESETLLVAHALHAEGFDASEDGTGRGTPLVAVAFDSKTAHGFTRAGEIAPTLRGMNHARSHANGGGQVAVMHNAQDAAPWVLAVRGRAEGRRLEARCDGLANALVTPSGGRDGIGVGALVTPALQVRRLTPRECERLMGVPDDYTLVPYHGKSAADGPRYRALGNSIAVPVLAWIGRRIAIVDGVLASTPAVTALGA